MKLDDESLLSAYLDGELDPDRRAMIESALSSDPEVAGSLRRLAGVRDLVAGLPRPSPGVDLAASIVARVASSPPPARHASTSWLRPRMRPRAVASMAGLGLAATLVVAVGLALLDGRPAPRPGRHHDLAFLPAAPVDSADEPAPTPPAATMPTVTSREVPAVRARAYDEGPGPDGARARERDAEQIRAMLDSPHLRRIFIVTDVMGGATHDRVEELVQKTPRTEATYGRITVTHGIVIDPRHPNEATVFAMVMNDQELRHFQEQLQRSCAPDVQVEDADADPGVVTQLAEIGQVAVLAGTSATDVVIPADATPPVALRLDDGRYGITREREKGEVLDVAHERREAEKASDVADPVGRSSGQPPSTSPTPTPIARRDDRPANGPLPASAVEPGHLAAALFSKFSNRKEPPSIVLVWVTSP